MSDIIINESTTQGFPLPLLFSLIGGLNLI